MIPGLLHGRVLGGGAPPGGIVASPAYQNLLSTDAGTTSASATSKITFQNDGVWETLGDNRFGQFPGSSGPWYLPNTAGIGSGYEIRMTPTLASGSGGVITNGAPTWTPLATAKSLSLLVQRFTNGESYAAYNVLIEIRPIGGSIQSSGTIRLSARATVGSGGGGSGTGSGTSGGDDQAEN